MYQYTTVPTCRGNTIGVFDDNCAAAFSMCPSGSGPLSTIWRRDNTNPTQPWQSTATTCFPGQLTQAGIPATAPTLTPEMIRSEWARTPFAVPGLSIQPPHNETLVTLPIYLTVTWSVTGYQPQQTRTVTLLGHTVQIRPTLRLFSYDFGDGHTIRTASPGGPYPTGDVQHPYPHSGTYRVNVSATYGGEYAVDGGSWFPINDTIVIAGTNYPIAVLTAENRLIPNPAPPPAA